MRRQDISAARRVVALVAMLTLLIGIVGSGFTGVGAITAGTGGTHVQAPLVSFVVTSPAIQHVTAVPADAVHPIPAPERTRTTRIVGAPPAGSGTGNPNAMTPLLI